MTKTVPTPTATDVPPERILCRVGDLKVGDWVVPGFMLGDGGPPVQILFAYAFQDSGSDCVLLAYREVDSQHPATELLFADTKMALAELADIPDYERGDSYGHDRVDNGDASAEVPDGVDGHAEFTGRATGPNGGGE